VPNQERQSPLMLVVLGLLFEEPMHAYRMQQLIRERGKDSIVNVAQRNSLYQVIARLVRLGLARVAGTERAENRPERTIYEITEVGSTTLTEWLQSMIATPERTFPGFPAALSSVMLLTPEVAVAGFRDRASALRDGRDGIAAEVARAAENGLPRLFLLEEDYQLALLDAELAWLEAVIHDLQAGELTWSPEWLAEISAQFEPQG